MQKSNKVSSNEPNLPFSALNSQNQIPLDFNPFDYHLPEHYLTNSTIPQKKNFSQIAENINELFLKNKINSKNAFQIPFIDVGQLEHANENDEQKWKKLASVLENDSKLYGLRVDFISQIINKMQGNINRNQEITQFQKAKKVSLTENGETLQLYEKKIEYRKFLQEKKSLESNQSEKVENNFVQKCLKNILTEKGRFLLNFLPLTPTLQLEFFLVQRQKVEKQPQERKMNFQVPINQEIRKFTIFSQISQLSREQYEGENFYEENQFIDEFDELETLIETDKLSNNLDNFTVYDECELMIESREEIILSKNRNRIKNVSQKPKKVRKKRKPKKIENILFENCSQKRKKVLKVGNKVKKNSLIASEKNLQEFFLPLTNQEFPFYLRNQSKEEEIEEEKQFFSYYLVNTTQNITNKNQQRTSIKKTKENIERIIENQARILFSNLCEEYENMEGSINTCLCFVGVLHLANELNLEVREFGEKNIQILKPN